jgi:hypothetical protein
VLVGERHVQAVLAGLASAGIFAVPPKGRPGKCPEVYKVLTWKSYRTQGKRIPASLIIRGGLDSDKCTALERERALLSGRGSIINY